MSTLLFPGRHLLNTRFQENYLGQYLQVPVDRLPLFGEKRCRTAIDEVVFAITSANQSHSRYNPIPLEVRAVGVDRFARPLREKHSVRCRIVPIPHYGPTPRFADFILKEVLEASEGAQALSPENTIVLSSTPELIQQFLHLGFGVLPAELESLQPARYRARTPMEVVSQVVAAGDKWLEDSGVRQNLSAATLGVWQDFPEVVRRVVRLYRDPLLTEQGSLTEMRNYSTYALGMGHQAILDIKYNDIRSAIAPGRIADEGCADGALLVPIARDFPDSDLIGIEITGEFMARCQERQRAMEYAGTYVHFHQRNITEPIFEAQSIDTTICNSTTHELWSYGWQEKTLTAYLAEKFRQTRKHGRLVIRDVVGPEDGDQQVLLWCNPDDGSNDAIFTNCSTPQNMMEHLTALSTSARFERFAADFLAGQRQRRSLAPFRFEVVMHAGRRFFQLPLRNAMEFLLKKDYCDNWNSELNEEFAFWSFKQWKHALTAVGFHILEDPNNPATASRAYASQWIIDHRFTGKAELYRLQSGALEKLPWPVTNMVLIGQK